MTYELESSAHNLIIAEVSEEQRQRARLAACEAAVDAIEAKDFLDALGLLPEGCYVGHPSRRSWCAHCRRKWPTSTS